MYIDQSYRLLLCHNDRRMQLYSLTYTGEHSEQISYNKQNSSRGMNSRLQTKTLECVNALCCPLTSIDQPLGNMGDFRQVALVDRGQRAELCLLVYIKSSNLWSYFVNSHSINRFDLFCVGNLPASLTKLVKLIKTPLTTKVNPSSRIDVALCSTSRRITQPTIVRSMGRITASFIPWLVTRH